MPLNSFTNKKALFAPHHPLPYAPLVIRDTFLLRFCWGKHVIHLGCADWPFTRNRYEAKQLLHQKLERVCAAIAGIDISEDGISFLRSRGIGDLFVGDASRIWEISHNLGWSPEIILAGEILEHVDASGPFLKEIAQQMPLNCSLLITVPNAFSIKGLLHIIIGHEKVNAEHVAYYSFSTMSQLLSRCGLKLVSMSCYKTQSGNAVEQAFDILLAPILRIRPHLSDGLIFCCRHLTPALNG